MDFILVPIIEAIDTMRSQIPDHRRNALLWGEIQASREPICGPRVVWQPGSGVQGLSSSVLASRIRREKQPMLAYYSSQSSVT